MTWSLGFSLLFIFFLICLSALFSGAETSFTATSRARMHHLEKKGSRRAAQINRLHKKKEMLIGSLLLGNNAVNVLASALMTSIMIGFFGEGGVLYATLCMTFIILVFAEILPKTYALTHADRSALQIAPFLHILTFCLSPITNTIQKFVFFILRICKLNVKKRATSLSSEIELRGTIDLYHEQKAHSEEGAMLQSILDLNVVEVSEVMTHRSHLVMLDADMSFDDIVKVVTSAPFSRIPVWQGDQDNIVGILHVKAVLRDLQQQKTDKNILTITTKPWFIPDTTNLFDQLQAFRKRHEHFAVVIDEYGSLMGIVTLEDILEEIVGNIFDEEDISGTSDIHTESEGTFIVRGTVTIRELNRQLDWRLPDDKAATIAGLIINEARYIPQVGQSLSFYGFQFEILSRQKNQITSLRVIPPKS